MVLQVGGKADVLALLKNSFKIQRSENWMQSDISSKEG
jgi:hypothetical protein